MHTWKWAGLMVATTITLVLFHEFWLTNLMLVTVITIAAGGVSLGILSMPSPIVGDAYDRAIEYLDGHDDRIVSAWASGYARSARNSPGWFLFQGLSQYGNNFCPVNLRRSSTDVDDLPPELLAAKDDERIPYLLPNARHNTIDRRAMEAIAEWQRKADAYWKRPTPEFV